jgi:hypothetical protein
MTASRSGCTAIGSSSAAELGWAVNLCRLTARCWPVRAAPGRRRLDFIAVGGPPAGWRLFGHDRRRVAQFALTLPQPLGNRLAALFRGSMADILRLVGQHNTGHGNYARFAGWTNLHVYSRFQMELLQIGKAIATGAVDGGRPSFRRYRPRTDVKPPGYPSARSRTDVAPCRCRLGMRRGRGFGR